MQKDFGAPRESRTPNLLIRSQMLYPIELRALNKKKLYKKVNKKKFKKKKYSSLEPIIKNFFVYFKYFIGYIYCLFVKKIMILTN